MHVNPSVPHIVMGTLFASRKHDIPKSLILNTPAVDFEGSTETKMLVVLRSRCMIWMLCKNDWQARAAGMHARETTTRDINAQGIVTAQRFTEIACRQTKTRRTGLSSENAMPDKQ